MSQSKRASSVDAKPVASVAIQADRPVDPRWAAVGYVLVSALVLGLAAVAASALWRNAQNPARVLPSFLASSAPAVSPAGPPSALRPAVVVVVDGLRRQDVRAIGLSFRHRPGEIVTWVRHERPTFAAAAHHVLFTGVPSHLSGVRARPPNGGARAPTLLDRVRAAGREVAVVTDGDEGLARLLTEPEDDVVVGPDDLGRAVDALVRRHTTASAPGLSILHMSSVAKVAAGRGLGSAAHLAALSEVGNAFTRVVDGTHGFGVVAALISSHGLVPGGGHGGGEADARWVPFMMRIPGIYELRPWRTLPSRGVAATLAAAMRLPPPALAVHAGLALPGFERRASEAAAMSHRAMIADQSQRLERRSEIGVRLAWSALVFFGFLCALGATKRSFGLDASMAKVPAILWLVVFATHLLWWHRPLSYSAVDDGASHALRVSLLGAIATALGIATALLSSPLATRGPCARKTALRRASAAAICTSGGLFFASFACIGGTLSPWPESDFAAYAPFLSLWVWVASWVVGSATLLGSLAKRGPAC